MLWAYGWPAQSPKRANPCTSANRLSCINNTSGNLHVLNQDSPIEHKGLAKAKAEGVLEC